VSSPQPHLAAQVKPTPDPRSRTSDPFISNAPAPANIAQNTVTISAVAPVNMTARTELQQARPETTKTSIRLESVAFTDTSIAQTSEQSQPRNTSPQHPATANLPQIARQLADVMPQLSTRQMTISLSPDELGKVQLSLSAAEKGMVVNVVTERAETLDLLRRNIAELGQEFQAMGYDNIEFSFAQSNTQSDTDFANEDTADSDLPTADLPETDAPEMITQLALSASKSLDIRL
jgi:flagellar hook-length control protein FliK